MPDSTDISRIDWHSLNYREMAEQAIRRYRLLKASGRPVSITIVDQNTGKTYTTRRPL